MYSKCLGAERQTDGERRGEREKKKKKCKNVCCACEARTNALRKKLIKVMDENAKAAHPRK